MTRATHAAPDQIRLAGQVAAHEGPVDRNVTHLMRHGLAHGQAQLAEAQPNKPLEEIQNGATWRGFEKRERLAFTCTSEWKATS